MDVNEKLLEKWKQCQEKRYRVLLIIMKPLDYSFPDSIIENFITAINARLLNFSLLHKGNLDKFISWSTIRDHIYSEGNSNIVVITELEPIYAKWPINERLTFLRNIIRSEPKGGIILIINCKENLLDIQSINERNRGMIWIP